MRGAPRGRPLGRWRFGGFGVDEKQVLRRHNGLPDHHSEGMRVGIPHDGLMSREIKILTMVAEWIIYLRELLGPHVW